MKGRQGEPGTWRMAEVNLRVQVGQRLRLEQREAKIRDKIYQGSYFKIGNGPSVVTEEM